MRTFILLFCTSVFSFSSGNLLSQNTKVVIDADMTVTIEEVFDIIDRQTNFSFIYRSNLFKGLPKVELKKGSFRINRLLLKSIDSKDFNFILTKDNAVIIKKKAPGDKKQEVKVSGRVTNEKGLPLPGVTVLIKGTVTGTATDFDGNYTLTVPFSENVLAFSFLGYETQEILVKDQTVIDVQLKPSITGLDEAIVIGYGKVKREALTGAVSSVDVKNITNQAPTVNLDNALQGQIAGVYISSATGQPGAAARVRIRGTTSLFGSNQPLYVIDGIPVVPNSNIPIGGTEGQNLGNQLAQEGISTPLGNINSADIESISVLKDASAAAIYGSRAANGVIIINTKQGVYSGKPKFDVNYSLSTQSLQTLDVLDANQYRQVWTTAVENGSSNDAFAQSVLDGSHFGNANTNWEDEVSPGNPLTTFFNINVYGGTQKTRYHTSIGINTQDGIYDGVGFDRYSYNLNLDTEINDNWKFGSKLNVSFANQKALDGGVTQLTYNYRPDLPVFNDEGEYSFSPTYSFENPVARSKASNNNKTLLLLGSFFTELRLAKGLHIKTLFALNYNNGNQQSFYPKFTFRGGWNRARGDGDGFAQESRSRFTNTLWQNTLTYNTLINDFHNVDVVLGASFEKTKNSFTKAFGTGFFNDVLTNISSATVSDSGSSFESGSGIESYFGRINYDYDDKYFITLSARVDGSSKFAKENTHAFFPAAAAAWRISKESFLENAEFIDELKLRVSLGKTGQQDFGDYAWRTLFETSNYGGDPSVILSQLGNDQLKWETTDQFDLGLDFSLFKGRLSGGIGYYVKDTKDALFTAIIPGSTGSNRIIANVGNTENKGIEFELKGDIIRKDDFSWNLGFNISKNKNKLTKISDDFLGDDGFLTGFGGGGRLREGSPIGLIYGYLSEGIFSTQEEIDALNTASPTGTYQNTQTAPGDLKFKDLTGPDGVPDGRITSLDQDVIGDTQPDFFGGITNTISYKGFTLSTFFSYSVGNDIQAFNLARDTNFFSTFFGENKTTDVLNAWTPDNTSTNIPRSVYRDPNNNGRISSHYVYKGSYLRLKTLNLNYTFPKEVIQKLKFIDNLSLYFTAQNLFTITNYPGADPEASNLYNNDISAGRDNNRFPIAKVFTTGIKIGF
ncbi:SusC/RagA family TonB-linked outer membrane protein [Flavivirga spongiicola]|uniref:TonB-dependent receptor n=1 Tax=Flavivirga spongiicola TaxID=421621 RepID=A0ABU7XYQ9_9FLAO|nr:TonB-dependent receptor [Flavivirga sp. MEBiC05379]MDO5980936.1 TonB-dependent receptor [Flavivirga sp. MEBiC05379]